ncbi:MAG TPA: CPBP family intramembrane glutamic endopeptidase [Thermoleophilia bacterium]|nr:CPBP family intramembrane glutamic endopeptidase [Thermoleophilia bacterium]
MRSWLWLIARIVIGYYAILWGTRWALHHVSLYGVVGWLARHVGAAYPDVGYPRLPETIVAVVVPVAVYVVFVLATERRAPRELGGGWRGLGELGLGGLIGLGLFAAIVGVLALAGSYHVLGERSWLTVQWSLFAAAAAFREELMFRGVVLRISEERFGTWIALALSSLWFGLAHANNPGATIVDSLMVALFGGLLLGAAYLATRRLWLAIGIHAMWNFAESGIFGVPVSGFVIPGWLSARLSGPGWLTGGAFGPEGSVVTLGVTAVAIAALLLIAWRRGCVRPPRLRRSAAAAPGTADTSFMRGGAT